MRRLISLLLLATASLLAGCGYNDMQSADETVKKSWSEVLNQYQRRADLIPNLVATVKGYAEHEQQVLTDVTNARSKVGQVQVKAEDLADPAKLKQFQQAQGELSSALSRLLVVTENYPELKADARFADLQAQIEGTENRITVARKGFIDSVQAYNVLIRSFPQNLTAMAMGYKAKESFTVENEKEISKAPKVDFSKPATAPAK
jgi:LemA protein